MTQSRSRDLLEIACSNISRLLSLRDIFNYSLYLMLFNIVKDLSGYTPELLKVMVLSFENRPYL